MALLATVAGVPAEQGPRGWPAQKESRSLTCTAQKNIELAKSHGPLALLAFQCYTLRSLISFGATFGFLAGPCLWLTWAPSSNGRRKTSGSGSDR